MLSPVETTLLELRPVELRSPNYRQVERYQAEYLKTERRKVYCAPMQLTDQELLTRISNKDGSALAELYERYSKVLYGVVLAMLKDTDDAEDILQEVFVQVWRKASTYQPALGHPKHWLIRIAHNRAVNLVRSKRQRTKQAEVSISDVTSGQEAYISESNDSAWKESELTEEMSYISEALTTLPEEQRLLIDLAFFQGYSHSEIADKTSVPLGTVKTRIRTGMHTLRDRLKFLNDAAV